MRIKRMGSWYLVYDETTFKEAEIKDNDTFNHLPGYGSEGHLKILRDNLRSLWGCAYGHPALAEFTIPDDMNSENIVYRFDNEMAYSENQMRDIIRKARRAASRLRNKAKKES